MATSQHRCVFVGNIPYDATEEQLIRICEEVGPVVSFRLVIDRETGKPKGYGFCEYKDEETALSARRNLQGYEINGRQLRVDFAENDKNMDKSREQGHGGPGMTTNVGDTQKQVGAQAVRPGSGLQQAIGLPVAMAAANVMAGALGGAQIAMKPPQIGLENQPGFGSDPLTTHLSKMSRNQLIDIFSELKVLATENKEQARQLLLVTPLLPKAIFQAQVMLGVVTPQMLQMPNIRQASFSSGQGQQAGVQTLPSFAPLVQSSLHSDLILKSQEGEVPAGHPNPLVQNNYTLPSTQPRAQLPVLSQSKYQQQGPVPVLPGPSTVLPVQSQNMMSMSVRPQIQVAASPYAKQQVQPYLFQHQGQAAPAKLGHNSQLVFPQGIREPFLSSSLNVGGVPNYTSTEYDRPPQLHNDSDRDTYQHLPQGLSEKATMIHDNQDRVNHPSKLLKMNDGRSASFSADVNLSTSVSGPAQVSRMYSSHPKTEEASTSEKQTSQDSLVEYPINNLGCPPVRKIRGRSQDSSVSKPAVSKPAALSPPQKRSRIEPETTAASSLSSQRDLDFDMAIQQSLDSLYQEGDYIGIRRPAAASCEESSTLLALTLAGPPIIQDTHRDEGTTINEENILDTNLFYATFTVEQNILDVVKYPVPLQALRGTTDSNEPLTTLSKVVTPWS